MQQCTDFLDQCQEMQSSLLHWSNTDGSGLYDLFGTVLAWGQNLLVIPTLHTGLAEDLDLLELE